MGGTGARRGSEEGGARRGTEEGSQEAESPLFRFRVQVRALGTLINPEP